MHARVQVHNPRTTFHTVSEGEFCELRLDGVLGSPRGVVGRTASRARWVGHDREDERELAALRGEQAGAPLPGALPPLAAQRARLAGPPEALLRGRRAGDRDG